MFDEDGEGELAGMGGFGGRAAVVEFVGFIEELADGGLAAPGDELGEGELVVAGDLVEGVSGLGEFAEDGADVELDVVDDGVDFGVGGVSREHVGKVTGRGGVSSGNPGAGDMTLSPGLYLI